MVLTLPRTMRQCLYDCFSEACFNTLARLRDGPCITDTRLRAGPSMSAQELGQQLACASEASRARSRVFASSTVPSTNPALNFGSSCSFANLASTLAAAFSVSRLDRRSPSGPRNSGASARRRGLFDAALGERVLDDLELDALRTAATAQLRDLRDVEPGEVRQHDGPRAVDSRRDGLDLRNFFRTGHCLLHCRRYCSALTTGLAVDLHRRAHRRRNRQTLDVACPCSRPASRARSRGSASSGSRAASRARTTSCRSGCGDSRSCRRGTRPCPP